MNKKNLIKKINSRSSFEREKSTMIFNRIFELIKKSITENKGFEIDNFGEFCVEHRKMKTMIDFKIKAEVLLPPKDRVVFLSSEKLKQGINI